MRLGEAKERLLQITQYLEDSVIILSRGPLSNVGDTLDKCNTLVKEQHNLISRIQSTEDVTDMGGESLREVSNALDVLSTKILLLEKISLRSDLSDSQREPIFKQLEAYRSSRDTLSLSLTRCLWEFELLD